MVIASVSAWCTPIVLFCVANLIIATLFIASKSSNTKTTNQHDHDHDHVNNAYSFGFVPRIPRVSSFLERAKSINVSFPRVSSFLERAKSINVSYIIPDIVIAAISLPESPSKTKTAKFTPLSRLAQSIFSTCSYDNQPDSKRYPSNKPKPTPSLLRRLKSIDISSIYDTNTITNESEDISDSHSQIVEPRVNSVKICTPKSEKRRPVKKTAVEVKKSRSEVRVVSDDEEDFDLRRPESARARRNADDDAKADNFINKFREQLKLQRLDSLDRYNDMLRRPS